MKLKLDLHDLYNRGGDIDRALRALINEAVTKRAPLVEIIPGKGSGALNKHALRFLDQKEIKALYHRVEKDSKSDRWASALCLPDPRVASGPAGSVLAESISVPDQLGPPQNAQLRGGGIGLIRPEKR